LAGGVTRLVRIQLGVSELGLNVDSDKEIQPSLFSADLSTVDVKVADSIFSELLLLRGLVRADPKLSG
jgi:hypothetical protein